MNVGPPQITVEVEILKVEVGAEELCVGVKEAELRELQLDPWQNLAH